MSHSARRSHPLAALLVGLSLAAALATGCALAPSQPSGAAPTVKIGIIAPLTGDGAGYGQYMLEGFKLKSESDDAISQLNGKKLELIVEDDAGKPERNPWRTLEWPAIAGHFGTPWFLPFVGAYYRFQDWLH